MNSNSKTTLELHQLLSCTMSKFFLFGKFIEKLKVEPSVEIYFGKTYFSVEIEFSLYQDSIVEKITEAEYEKMQISLHKDSQSRTHVSSQDHYRNNHLNTMLEIREIEANYQFFINTLRSFTNQYLPNFSELEHEPAYSLESDIDSNCSYPLIKFRNEIIENFFYGVNNVLTTDDISNRACYDAFELTELKKKQAEDELQKHLANRKLIASPGDYCIVLNQYHQPLNLMEITEIGNRKDNTYIGFEVKTVLQTGKNPITITNESIACVFSKELLDSISKSLGKDKSKKAVIMYLSKIKDEELVKYYNKKCFSKIS